MFFCAFFILISISFYISSAAILYSVSLWRIFCCFVFFFSNFLWTFNQVILLQLVINSQNPTWKGKAFWEIAVVGAYSQ